jgi:Ca2+-transporting ATPase
MGGGTLAVIAWASGAYDDTVARTMGVATFSLFRIASSLETADENRSVFSGYILGNPALLKATGLSIVTIVLATELGILQNVLGMTSLTGQQWLVCIGVALSLIVVEEVKKALKIKTGEEPVASTSPAVA